MQLDLEQPGSVDLYQLATHLVTPRPIAWVITQNAAGVVNLAPFSYFGLVCDNPILLVLSLGRKSNEAGMVTLKDTSRNLLETGQAVVHLVEEANFESMVKSSTDLPAHQSEVSYLGLTTVPCTKVSPPRLSDAKLSLECVLYRHLEIGNEPGDMFLLRGVVAHLDDSALSNGLPDPVKLRILGKLGGSDYTVTTLAKSLKRPRFG